MKCEICPNKARKGCKTCGKSCASRLANRHRKVARCEVGVFFCHPILDKFIYGPVTS